MNNYSDKIKERVLSVAKYTILNRATVRETAEVFGVSKSTVHKDLSKKLYYINKHLYRDVQSVLKKNLNERHLRGGEATRNKFLM